MHSDEIIEAVGGMSRFQVLLLFVILGPQLLISCGMFMMSFASVTPDNWQCNGITVDVNGTGNGSVEHAYNKTCPSTNSSLCTFEYSAEKLTVINQWDLICDKRSITSLIIALQMVGFLVGSLLGGQSADVIGRKKTYVICLLLHAGFNLVAAFSPSWQMFAALRFFIGSVGGAVLTVCTPYFIEFVSVSWRPVPSAVPFWEIGMSLLALSCWLRPYWSDLHIILTLMHIPFLLGLIFAPESLRWLAVHGHLEEAEKVVDQMTRYNGTEKPANTTRILKELAEQERKGREAGHKYGYIDIYRGWSLCRKSLMIQFIWMGTCFVNFGIYFSVGSLHGNLYFNMFLVGIIGIAGSVAVYFLNNRIGRRRTGFTFCSIAVAGSLGVVIASQLVGRGTITTALALVCNCGVTSTCVCYIVFTSESYPTSVRNLGYGAANCAGRIGAIIAPYVFALGDDDIVSLFIIVCSVMVVCAVLCLFMTETMGVPLQDTTITVTTDPCKREEIDMSTEHVSQNKGKEQEEQTRF